MLLSTRGTGKDFDGVWVLRDVDFELREGEIHSLVGENGAGKSTFIKIISGVHSPSEGELMVEDRPVSFASVRESEDAGIRTVHQEIDLIPYFNVVQNIFVGDDWSKRFLGVPYTDDRGMKKRAGEVLERLRVDLDVSAYAYQLDASRQKIIQICKVLVNNPRVLIFDEPTTALGEEEREQVLSVIEGLRGSGVGIIYISHNLEEVMRLSDRITVFRDGAHIGTMDLEEASTQRIVSMMIGHSDYESYHRRTESLAEETRLKAADLVTHKLRGVSLSVHRGEILGVAGVVGAGKSEIANALFGIDPLRSGRIEFDGRPYRPSPKASVRQGLALVPEERKEQGLVPNFSVAKNISLSYLEHFSRYGVSDEKQEQRVAEEFIDSLSIKTQGPRQIVHLLSGGNQQKVVLARWLHGDFSVGIFDEPTKGIDVNAKGDIYRLLSNLASDGKGILFLSSYLPELLNLCDRILVIRDGRIVGDFDPTETDAKETITHAMLGGVTTS